MFFFFFFFFFQAEDGIRDRDVTGVQTCALPISWVNGTPLGVGTISRGPPRGAAGAEIGRASCREKSVDLGGRRIIKKKKKKKKKNKQNTQKKKKKRKKNTTKHKTQ